MPSKRQSETSRRNGAKSHGPITPEGQARSSQNALRHGLTAAVVVLPHEDPAEFEQLCDAYIRDFHPATQSQFDLVETLAATRWRMNRLLSVETRLFEQEISRHEETMGKEFTDLDGAGKLAWTFNKMANTGTSLTLLQRYESQLNRTYARALQQLHDLQSARTAATPPPPILARVNPHPPNHLPELPNEPAEPVFLPVHRPPETPPAATNSGEGDEILAA